MTRREFIDTLTEKLSEELSSAEVLSQVQYYQGYIDGELQKGRTEEAVLDDLGDPNLIAKTIIESPHDDDPFFGRNIPDSQDAYEEGAYQGRNSKSAEEVQREAEASRRATESQYRKAAAAARAAREERAAKMAENLKNEAEKAVKAAKAAAGGAEAEKDAAPENGQDGSEQPGTAAGEQPEEDGGASAAENAERANAPGGDGSRAQRSKTSGDASGSDADQEGSGGFNWTLFAFIIAAVIVVAVVIWLAVTVVSALGPSLLIILAIVLILLTIFGSRRR